MIDALIGDIIYAIGKWSANAPGEGVTAGSAECLRTQGSSDGRHLISL
jgi:hypothetical protein